MDRDALALFLRSHRGSLDPARTGLVVDAGRRVPGLRREEVADRAHISVEYYTQLEQARGARPSPQVLIAVAGALELTATETRHLHHLTGSAPPLGALVPRQVRPSLQTLLTRLPLTAGFVITADFEVVAWNQLAAALMEDFGALPDRERNLARRAFLTRSPGPGELAAATLYGVSDADQFRHHVASRLHAAVARYPHDGQLWDLVGDLRTGSAAFEALWAAGDVESPTMLEKTFDHPVVGPTAVTCDVLDVADLDQQVVLYSAPPDSDAAHALQRLAARPRTDDD